eukprot:TRINITY_DN15241_c0_g1_i1.p1 TRINITY_DN15241_c0_g1~~TRINITY_DN15241_c0_g1_i1.p1  ORF type:complete len:163 (+),score=28.81 TRINITY_DN15241_c0_g1_i1:109-597(+)
MLFKGTLLEIYFDAVLRMCQDVMDGSFCLDNRNIKSELKRSLHEEQGNPTTQNQSNNNNNSNNASSSDSGSGLNSINNNNSNNPGSPRNARQCEYDCVCRSACVKSSLLHHSIPFRIGFGPHFSNGFRMAELCIIAAPLTKEQIYFVANGLLFDPQLTTALA